MLAVIALVGRMPEARAGGDRPGPASAPVAPLPLDFAVVDKDGAPVAGIEWLAPQLANAASQYAKLGLRFAVMSVRRFAGNPRIETRKDRDELGQYYQHGYINVFIVEALRDIDTAGDYERGVCWGDEKHTAIAKYIIIQAGSPPGVLTHELGHMLGLGHSHQVDNVMSYSRSKKRVPFFMPIQAAEMRAYAKKLYQMGFLQPGPEDKVVKLE